MNRPQTLNALSLKMIRAVSRALLTWRHDPEVHTVVLHGRGGKALCVGGDIRFFHCAAMTGDPQLITFFTEGHRLNHLILSYTKPYIALVDDVAMGGGMDISQGASLRVVTEHMKVAMPETNVGLFPDVGDGWFLARVPGRVSEYLGVTGRMVETADTLSVGLADCHITTGVQTAIIQCLRDGTWGNAEQITACFTEAASAPDGTKAVIASHREAIDICFSQSNAQGILADLTGSTDTEWVTQTAVHMAKRPPLMMAVALELIRHGRRTMLTDELRRGLDVMTHMFAESDGIEGIRALTANKDHVPRQKHASIDVMRDDEVAAFFVSPWYREQHPLLGLSDQNRAAVHLGFEPLTCCDR